MGILLGDGLANFVVTLSTVFVLSRFSVASKLLEGLHIFNAQSGEEQGQEKTKGSSKSARWQNKANVRQKIYSEGAEQLVRFGLPKGAASKSFLYEELELLVNLGVILLGNALVCATPLTDLHLASTSWPLFISLAAPLSVVFLLFKAEFFAANRQDKRYVVVAIVLISILAFGSTYIPNSILDFDWEASAEDLSDSLVKARQTLHISPETVGRINIPDISVRNFMAILAGMLSGCLIPGALRVSRSFMLASQPPPATEQYSAASWQDSVKMILALALPFLGTFAWVRPMVQDRLQLSEDTVEIARVSLFLLMAFLAYIAMRPLMSGYLSSGLLVWWTFKNAMTSWDKHGKYGDAIQKRVRNINLLICKVAIEFLAPVVLWGSLGCLLAYSTLTRERIPGYVWLQENLQLSGLAGGKQKVSSAVPVDFLANAAGFLAWWTSLSWSIALASFITLFRTGLLPEV